MTTDTQHAGTDVKQQKDSIIQLRDICKSFGDKVVFRHVNLKFRPGETTVVIGASGVGKRVL